MKRALERSPRAMIAQSGRGRPRSALRFLGRALVLADALTDHEPGRDAFHRVPILSGEFRDAVECVPTGLNGRFMGRQPPRVRPGRRWNVAVASLLLLPICLVAADVSPLHPETGSVNLALEARASATSEHSTRYRARCAVDGRIPTAGSQEDLDHAWCVQGDTHRNGAAFTLEWTNDVTVAEVVYWGRTAWFAEECWKDYELWLDQSPAPTVTGQLRQGHGPQRIQLTQPARARRLTLKFTSSYGGLNPGASEIQVYGAHLPARSLATFRPLPRGQPEVIDEAIQESPELAARLVQGRLGFDTLLLIQRRELNPSHVYTYHVEGFGAGGGLFIGALHGPDPLTPSLSPTGGEGAWRSGQGERSPDRSDEPDSALRIAHSALRQLVASPAGQILDCDLSYDAKEVLFSWRRKQLDGYQVFVVNTDGTNLRQLTDGPHHNYNACWLPDGAIAFLSTRSSRFAYCWISPVGILHRMERDGSRVTQLSANIVNDFTPSVLSDGRIIYSRWEYVDKPAIPVQSLWTIHPDGTGLAGFFGNRVLSPATFMEARSIPGTTKALCVLTSHNGPCRGAIGIIDPSFGNNAQAGIRNLTPEVAIGLVNQGDGNSIRGPYESPYPLDAEFFLVSKRGTILVRNFQGTQAARVIGPKDGLGFYSAQPVRPRHRPPVLASTLARAEDLPTSPVTLPLSPTLYSRPDWATVVLQDVYRGLEPHVKRGEVTEICVVEEMRKAVRTDVANRHFGFQFPVISCGATYAGKLVWGYAPVAADGSACFQVPAGRPIYFMALDAHGRAVQRMRTFTHLMPGETQGCVGCHEPRQQTTFTAAPVPPSPDDLPGRARLPSSPDSISQSIGARRESRPPESRPGLRRGDDTTPYRPSPARAPDRLRPPEWGVGIGFDYATHVQPVLDAHCVRCHSGPTPPKKVDLCGDKTDFFNVSYEWLARGRKRSGEAEWDSPYVSWIPTYNGMEQNILEVTPKAWGSPRSKLAEILLSGHPETNGAARLKMEPREIRRVLAWMDLNVPYYGTSETERPDVRGCRQTYPATLDATLADVTKRRCAECHADGKVPRPFWTRITNPQMNSFLLAPLARDAGGSGRCGQPVFRSPADPDYQAILRTFDPVLVQLRELPRMDMVGGKPANVDRNCLGKLD